MTTHVERPLRPRSPRASRRALAALAPALAVCVYAPGARADLSCPSSLLEETIALPAAARHDGFPAVAHARSGTDIVVWNDASGLRAARIRTSDRTLLDPASITVVGPNVATFFDVAASDGDFLVAWVDTHGEVRTSRLRGADGALLDPAGGVRVSPAGDATSDGVQVASSHGNYVVLWNQGGRSHVFAARVRQSDGALLDAGGGTSVANAWIDLHAVGGTDGEVGALLQLTASNGQRDLGLLRLDPATGSVVAQAPLRPTLPAGTTYFAEFTNGGLTADGTSYVVSWVPTVESGGFGQEIGITQRIAAGTGAQIWQHQGPEGYTASDAVDDVLLDFGLSPAITARSALFLDRTSGADLQNPPGGTTIHLDAYALAGAAGSALVSGAARGDLHGIADGTLVATYLTRHCTDPSADGGTGDGGTGDGGSPDAGGGSADAGVDGGGSPDGGTVADGGGDTDACASGGGAAPDAGSGPSDAGADGAGEGSPGIANVDGGSGSEGGAGIGDDPSIAVGCNVGSTRAAGGAPFALALGLVAMRLARRRKR